MNSQHEDKREVSEGNSKKQRLDPTLSRPLSENSVPNKLSSWDFYKSIGSPKFIVAPMVDASELAWRILSRMNGAQLCYTPMINAGQYARNPNPKFRQQHFDLINQEEGHSRLDRPLIAQFCTHDKDAWLESASHIAAHGSCDAVDLNLGCPQGIAKRGRYGAFLMSEWDLVEKMINHLHRNLSIPVTAKFRCFESTEETIKFAKMLERAGAQIITLHGRTKEQKGQFTGLADWDKIRAVKEAVSIPVFANGNIMRSSDVDNCLEYTKADGVMSAEGNLYNPVLFRPLATRECQEYFQEHLDKSLQEKLLSIQANYSSPASTSSPSLSSSPLSCSVSSYAYAPCILIAKQYLCIVRHLKTQTTISAIKGHLFKIFQPIFNSGHLISLRNELGKCGTMAKVGCNESENTKVKSDGKKEREWEDRVGDFELVVDMIAEALAKETDSEKKEEDSDDQQSIITTTTNTTETASTTTTQISPNHPVLLKPFKFAKPSPHTLTRLFSEDQKDLVSWTHCLPYIRPPVIIDPTNKAPSS